jgi:beta-galactosidase
VVHVGGNNTIAVKVDASKFEGWFYEGAGIYRHVRLDKSAPLAIAPDGIFVGSKFKNNVPSERWRSTSSRGSLTRSPTNPTLK